MLDFLRTKIKIIQDQAAVQNQSFLQILAVKIGGMIGTVLVLLFDLLFFLILIPFYFILLVGIRFTYNPSRWIYFIGLEHIIDKTSDRADALVARGFSVRYFSYEMTGQRGNRVPADKVIKHGWLISFDFLHYLWLFLWDKPALLEVYLEGDTWRQFLMCLTAKFSGCKVAVIERGQLSNFIFNTITAIKKQLMLLIYKFGDVILYREPYMEEIFEKYQVDSKKLVFDFNRVPIRMEPDFNRKEKVVLFLNGFAKFRRLDIVVDSIPLVRKEMPDVKYVFVGARNQLEMDEAWKILREKNIDTHVEVHGWTTQPATYFQKASVFVLPADLIFCNFSLLEAMERGVPPIIANMRDADRIVMHGKSGYLCAQNATNFAGHILELLGDEEKRQKMAREAREKVKRDYDNADRMKPILDLIAA